MKRLNKELIVLILGAAFIILGYSGRVLYMSAAYSYHLAIRDFSFERFTELMEEEWTKDLNYYDELMNLNSLFLRYTGAKSVVKDKSTTILKLDNGYLTSYIDYISNQEIDKSVAEISKLWQYTKGEDVKFLYVACPMKGYYTDYPEGFENNVPSNLNRFYGALDLAGVPLLNLTNEMAIDGISEEEAFFITDHHWKPETGLWATRKILENFYQQYEYEYNKEYVDITNYNTEVYKEWFLGSQGKKTGAYFSELGADDFTLITPKFETELTEVLPLSGEKRYGSFSESLIFNQYVEKKDWYNLNTYITYSGGNFHLQLFENHMAENNRKVLLLGDSFSCVVSPFLALQNKTTYIVDLRSNSNNRQEKPNVYELINEIQPDYVIMLYTETPLAGPMGSLDLE